jgi:hypothetical protein
MCCEVTMTLSTSSVFALLFAIALAAPAAAQRETETVDQTLTMQPGGELRLRTFSGRVRITGGAGDQVVIKAVRRATRARLDEITLDIAQSGNTIEIQANRRLVERRNDNDRENDGVVETDFDIQVPTRTRLDIKTFSAPVTVIGVNGTQKIDGFSSGIRVEAAEWADGNDLDIHTFSGEIDLRLPDATPVGIDFNTFSGEFRTDLPVTLQSSNRRSFRGELNGGGSTDLRVQTFSGSVNMRR